MTAGSGKKGPYMPKAQKTDWETPPALFDGLDAEWGPFTCDPACQVDQYTAVRVLARGSTALAITPQTDGLATPWRGRVFLNPPYGSGVEDWVAKAVREVEEGRATLVCALLKATTDTQWWQRYVLREAGPGRLVARPALALCRFLPGRVRFVGGEGPAPFPSAVVVWQRQ